MIRIKVLRCRSTFRFFDFPDCSTCYRPAICYYRTVEHRDCYGHNTPCGECLWARGIVVCP